MAVAGYALASSVATWGLSFWLGIVIGLLLTVVLALLLGVPTLRLRADYLAIVTIAAAEIIRQVVGSVTLLEYFGGLDGLQDFNDSFANLNPFDKTDGHRRGRDVAALRLLRRRASAGRSSRSAASSCAC